MKLRRNLFLMLGALALGLAGMRNGIGQELPPPPPPGPGGPDTMYYFPENPVGGVRVGKFGVIGMMELNNKLVTGAPYSAQATTETTQTLGDGNRIVRTETSQLYRDSQGRTRHERTLSMLGPWSAGASGESGAGRQVVTINDPVAGVHYVLNPHEKTVMKMPAPPPGAKQRFVTNLKNRALEQREQERPEPTSESLGTQTIEGVQAEGTRVTETIPAGQIGNERPITIVSERWYSPQLQAYVLTKRSDPRFGDTVYKLSNINRAEPSPELFQVPADYAVKEGRRGVRFSAPVPPPS